MKILRLYYLLPPKMGGMEKHIFYVTKKQLEKGNEVTVMFNYGNKISNRDIKLLPYIKLFKIKPLFIGIIVFYLAVLKKLFLKQENFDVIHIHGDWSSLLFVNQLKKLTNAKIIVFSLHGQLTNKYTHKKLLPKFIKNIDLIFSTGYDTAHQLYTLTKREIIVQPSGINEIFFEEFRKNFENDKFTIITVANLFPKKNLEFILEIAKELNKFEFIIIGEGSHRNILEKIIKKENINNVKLLGFKLPHEIKTYYQNSDIYLLTSFAEGTPTSALEAMACGLPIVSSNAGGLSNIVKENRNGFIIKEFKKELFIQKILYLNQNKQKREEIFENNRKLAKNYNWNNVEQNITNLIKKALDEKD